MTDPSYRERTRREIRSQDPSEIAAADDLLVFFHGLLAEELRSVFDLMLVEYTCSEIAEKLALTHTAARRRKEKVRKILSEYIRSQR